MVLVPVERVALVLRVVVVLLEREGDVVVVVPTLRVALPVRVTCVALLPLRVGVELTVRVAVRVAPDTLLLSRATLLPRVTLAPPLVVASVPRTAVAPAPRVRTFVLPKVELRLLVLCSDRRVCPPRPTAISVRAAWRTVA
jgi:hypothetical protein